MIDGDWRGADAPVTFLESGLDHLQPKVELLCYRERSNYEKIGERMDHSTTFRNFFGAISAHDLDEVMKNIADDFVEHETAPGLEPTREGVRQLFTMLIAAFPDLEIQVEDLLPSGDNVVARVLMKGTNEGEFMGMPPTGKRVEVKMIDVVRFGEDGLAHEHWGLMDTLSMMQQLGLVPGAPQA